MQILENLKKLSKPVPQPPALPTKEQIKNAEEKLDIKFPPSYVEYQLGYSNLFFGKFEPYQLFEDGSYLDLMNAVKEARSYGLPEHLLPFPEDNGDYFCFDLKSTSLEYEIRYWNHSGSTNEKWENFLDWVEKCWMKENY